MRSKKPKKNDLPSVSINGEGLSLYELELLQALRDQEDEKESKNRILKTDFRDTLGAAVHFYAKARLSPHLYEAIKFAHRKSQAEESAREASEQGLDEPPSP